MPRVFIGIGSNINKGENIRGAVRELATHFGHLTLSPVYETKAVGLEGGNFYNLVTGFDTGKSIQDIKALLSQIESRFGRLRQGERFSSRTLDLDLLLHGDTVRQDDKVNLPHSDIQRYAFVLRPLADIAPDLRHPETGLTYIEMWKDFKNSETEMRTVKFDFEN